MYYPLLAVGPIGRSTQDIPVPGRAPPWRERLTARKDKFNLWADWTASTSGASPVRAARSYHEQQSLRSQRRDSFETGRGFGEKLFQAAAEGRDFEPLVSGITLTPGPLP